MAFALMVEGTPNPIHADAVKKALLKLARDSMEQPGTIRYDFFQAEVEPVKFILIALWEDEQGWKTHVASETHERYLASLPENAWDIRPRSTKMRPLDEVQ